LRYEIAWKSEAYGVILIIPTLREKPEVINHESPVKNYDTLIPVSRQVVIHLNCNSNTKWTCVAELQEFNERG